jgi:ATP-dependent Clp protease protease subunit
MNFIKEFKPETIAESLYKDLLEKRIIYLNEDITDSIIDIVAMPILIINEIEKDIPIEKLKPLTIYINSYGGSVEICSYLIEVIENSRVPIHCRVLSIAASAALYMTIACHKRFASKNSILLLHKGSIQIQGNMGEAEDIMDFYKEEIGSLFDDLIVRRTKITKEELKKIRRKETYCLGEKALELGFVDEIV